MKQKQNSRIWASVLRSCRTETFDTEGRVTLCHCCPRMQCAPSRVDAEGGGPTSGVGVVGTRMPGELRQVLDECFLSALATWSFFLNYKISSNSKT